MPDIVHSVLPQSLQQGGLLTFVPLFFSHGMIAHVHFIIKTIFVDVCQNSQIFTDSMGGAYYPFRFQNKFLIDCNTASAPQMWVVKLMQGRSST